MSRESSAGGVGLGAVIAVVCSWSVNHNVLWCILHAICGWLYVIYWIIEYSAAFK